MLTAEERKQAEASDQAWGSNSLESQWTADHDGGIAGSSSGYNSQVPLFTQCSSIKFA